MRVEPAGIDVADELADLWVELAASQREYGSHVLADENRARVRESFVRHAVTDGLVVARAEDDEGTPTGEGDALLGFASFHPETGAYEQDVSRGMIENVYVVPGRRGEGVGSALLEAAERRLFEAGCDVVVLEAMADNERARRFYRRHGYEPHRVEMERTDSDKTDAG